MMAAKDRSPDPIYERCAVCGRKTAHAVSLELRTESDEEKNAHYSREPYRITRCLGCGKRRSQRMNDA